MYITLQNEFIPFKSFFPLSSVHFEPVQINLHRNARNAGGKMNMELRQGELVALSGKGWMIGQGAQVVPIC